MIPARADRGCAALTLPAARSTTTRRLAGPWTAADETVTDRRPRDGHDHSHVGRLTRSHRVQRRRRRKRGKRTGRIREPRRLGRRRNLKTECGHQRVHKLLLFDVEQSGDIGLAQEGPRATGGRKPASERRHGRRWVGPRERVTRSTGVSSNRREALDRARRRRQAEQAIRAGKLAAGSDAVGFALDKAEALRSEVERMRELSSSTDGAR